ILDQVTKALPPYTWLTGVSVAGGGLAAPGAPGSSPASQTTDSTGVTQVRVWITGSTVDIQAYTTFLRQLAASPWLADVTPATTDDISTKAKVRGVTIGRIEPFAPETGSPFDTYRYRLEIIGHYDQLGEFLSDIASLPRIIVPQDVLLKPAQQQAQRLLGDTLGSLLEAQFQIRTFVKAAAPPGVAPSPKRGGKP